MPCSGRSQATPSSSFRESQVLADDGKTVLDVACNPEEFEVHTFIEVRAGEAVLFFTPDHRVPVLRGPGVQPCDVQAKDLQQGDHVFVNGIPTDLISAQEQIRSRSQRVLKIAFKPDKPVAVFTPPSAISSKGHALKRVHRGGMRKRGKAGKVVRDDPSIPDTQPGVYQE